MAGKKKPSSPPRPITQQQALFAAEYVVDNHATNAAIRAGYSKKTAYSTGSRLLKIDEIQAEIAKNRQEAAKRVHFTQDMVLSRLRAHLMFDQADLYNDDGTFKAVKDMDPATRAVITSIEADEITIGEAVVGTTKKIKTSDNLKAVELSMRYLGMLNDKLKVQGDAANPLTVLLQQIGSSALRPVQDDPEHG